MTNKILLTRHEVQSGHNRQKHAEGLILQLPGGHDGRNTWLLNYGVGIEAQRLRDEKRLRFDTKTMAAESANDQRGQQASSESPHWPGVKAKVATPTDDMAPLKRLIAYQREQIAARDRALAAALRRLERMQELAEFWILRGQPGPHPSKEEYNTWLALGFHSGAWARRLTGEVNNAQE